MRQTKKERKEPSREQAALLAIFEREPQAWFDNNTLERRAKSVSDSTIRHLTGIFYEMKLLDRALGFGGAYRYRLAPGAQDTPYFKKVKQAAGETT